MHFSNSEQPPCFHEIRKLVCVHVLDSKVPKVATTGAKPLGGTKSGCHPLAKHAWKSTSSTPKYPEWQISVVGMGFWQVKETLGLGFWDHGVLAGGFGNLADETNGGVGLSVLHQVCKDDTMSTLTMWPTHLLVTAGHEKEVAGHDDQERGDGS